MHYFHGSRVDRILKVYDLVIKSNFFAPSHDLQGSKSEFNRKEKDLMAYSNVRWKMEMAKSSVKGGYG